MTKEQDPVRVYLLPNLMTAGNLFCGFMAVLQIFQGISPIARTTDAINWVDPYQQAVLYILAAFVFDLLDGRLARLGGQESAFGREFDSLADVISFGIAPALLVYKIVLCEWEKAGLVIAFLYLVCGAMRLARFNVYATMKESGTATGEFTGFPIPAAAGLVASITLVLLQVYENDNAIGNWKYLLAGVLLFLSVMMFSKYRYPSFKKIDWRTRKSVPTVLAVIAVMALVILYYQKGLAVLFTSYLLYGFFRPHISRAWRKYLEVHSQEDEDPEGDENGNGKE